MADRSMFGPNWTVAPTGNGNEHHLFDHRGKVAATGYKGEKMQYIADCINACADLPDPSVVRELVELLRELLSNSDGYLSAIELDRTLDGEDWCERAAAAISKATQGEG